MRRSETLNTFPGRLSLFQLTLLIPSDLGSHAVSTGSHKILNRYEQVAQCIPFGFHTEASFTLASRPIGSFADTVNLSGAGMPRCNSDTDL